MYYTFRIHTTCTLAKRVYQKRVTWRKTRITFLWTWRNTLFSEKVNVNRWRKTPPPDPMGGTGLRQWLLFKTVLRQWSLFQ
jgi:hypothetical protein